MGGDNYSDQQHPAGGYADGGGSSGSTNYGDSKNTPSPYAASEQVASTHSGLANGVNLQPSYSSGGNVDLGWELMKKNPNIKAVRIEIEAGQEINAQRWIKEAVGNGYSVIATFHSWAMIKNPNQVAMDDPDELLNAAAWWATNYPTLRKSGAFAINLMNEWGSHGITSHDFAATYNKAIAKVRSVYDGPIIVDIPGYGQEAHTANLAITGTAGGETIKDPKIILSTHIYPQAYNEMRQRNMTTADLDEMASTGLDCIVGEFGDDGSGGKTKWDDLVKYAKSKGWPVFGWAWNGDGGIMNMIDPKGFQPLVPGKPYTYTASGYFSKIYNLL
jgi:mannan endo-1,4-beta-mannosidase